MPVNSSAGTATVDYDPTSNSKYGVLYNFCAASAGTYCYPNTTNYGNASYDICPAGWRLPVGGTSGEYVTLYGKYNTVAKMHSPVTSGGAGFAFPGYFTNAGIKQLDNYGYYWSSTRSDNTIMYDMSINASTVYPAHSGSDGRRCGRSIRCIKNN